MRLGTSPLWCRNARYHGCVVPCSHMEEVELPWQQNYIMVLCGCHCSAKPLWRGRGHHQPFPDGQAGADTPCPGALKGVQRDVKVEGGRQQCGTCSMGAKCRARETKLPLG